MASNSDNHDIVVVHNVGAKLRLDCVNCMINISKDTQAIFVSLSRSNPFGYREIQSGWIGGPLTGTPSFSVREVVYLTVSQGGSCRKRILKADFICSNRLIVQLCLQPTF
jgi:hypothetical protein